MPKEDSHYLKHELYNLVKTDAIIFDFIQEASLDGIWYWDLERPENEWMSPKLWELLGYAAQEKQHLAKEWQSLIYPADLALASRNFELHCKDQVILMIKS